MLPMLPFSTHSIWFPIVSATLYDEGRGKYTQVAETTTDSVWQYAQSKRHLQVGTELIKARTILNVGPYVVQLSLSRRYLSMGA